MHQLKTTRVPYTTREYQDVLYHIRLTTYQSDPHFYHPDIMRIFTHRYVVGSSMACFDWLNRSEEEREALSEWLKVEVDAMEYYQTFHEKLPGSSVTHRMVDHIRDGLILSKVSSAMQVGCCSLVVSRSLSVSLVLSRSLSFSFIPSTSSRPIRSPLPFGMGNGCFRWPATMDSQKKETHTATFASHRAVPVKTAVAHFLHFPTPSKCDTNHSSSRGSWAGLAR